VLLKEKRNIEVDSRMVEIKRRVRQIDEIESLEKSNITVFIYQVGKKLWKRAISSPSQTQMQASLLKKCSSINQSKKKTSI
jgi:hypothetical protein